MIFTGSYPCIKLLEGVLWPSATPSSLSEPAMRSRNKKKKMHEGINPQTEPRQKERERVLRIVHPITLPSRFAG